MRDICLISRDVGHLMKMRDCPSECGTVDTYAWFVSLAMDRVRYHLGLDSPRFP